MVSCKPMQSWEPQSFVRQDLWQLKRVRNRSVAAVAPVQCDGSGCFCLTQRRKGTKREKEPHTKTQRGQSSRHTLCASPRAALYKVACGDGHRLRRDPASLCLCVRLFFLAPLRLCVKYRSPTPQGEPEDSVRDGDASDVAFRSLAVVVASMPIGVTGLGIRYSRVAAPARLPRVVVRRESPAA